MTTTTATTNGFRDSDAIPDIEYVLELPADRASTLCGELMRVGVPGDRIKVIEPGRVPPQIPSATTVVVEPSRGQQRTGPEKKKSNGNGYGDGRQRRQQRVARFLPRSIKLGTYSGGQYNVSIRRRAVPEGREFVWVSMATDRTAAAVTTTAAERKCRKTSTTKASHDDDDDDETNGLAIVMRRCRCAGAACDEHRNALRKYLEVDDDDDDDDGGERPVDECVYRRFADALPMANVDRGNGADDDRVKPPPGARVLSVGKPTEDNDDDGNGNDDNGGVTGHAGRLAGGGGSVDRRPTSEPHVSDGRKITDDTTTSRKQQACQQSGEARFFDGDATAGGSLTTTANTTTTSAVVAEPSRTDVAEHGTVERQSPRPAETGVGAKRTKKSLLDRLPWRATNRSRNGAHRRPVDDGDVKAAAVVANKARRRPTDGREAESSGGGRR